VIAYLDCVGGLAGDMLIAALLDAGASERALRAVPARLGLDGVELRIERVERHGIGALHLDVAARAGAQEPGHTHHHPPHRSWRSIRGQLAQAELSEPVRARSLAVFSRLAEVEAAIHAVPPEDIHFHELGAEDTLIDVVGALTLLDDLGVRRLVCSPLPMGRGVTRAAHGVIPLPAPATAALLVGAPAFGLELEAETVTPTGAALAATLADEWGPLPALTLRSVGYGAGTADFADRANVVRVLLGEAAAHPADDAAEREVVVLETNLDDVNPELVPDAVDRCFAAGALDVWTVPVMMKKGRPGFVLSALARPAHERAVAYAMLEETTALGVRVGHRRRYELEREERTVEIDGQAIRVKLGRLDGRIVNVAPEHDDCAAVAHETGAPVKSVWIAALAAARELR
jgi:pyridinium-3,5-bisthiocarboxylic acid mononucleotide nickel chelatase